MWNVYRNRWCGRYWQEFGIKVIPSIQWGGDDNLEWCLDGLPKHSTIAISTTGDGRWGNHASIKRFYDKTLDKLEPETVLLYGKDLSAELRGNIVYKKLINSKVVI